MLRGTFALRSNTADKLTLAFASFFPQLRMIPASISNLHINPLFTLANNHLHYTKLDDVKNDEPMKKSKEQPEYYNNDENSQNPGKSEKTSSKNDRPCEDNPSSEKGNFDRKGTVDESSVKNQ